jgi:uncharacterized protein
MTTTISDLSRDQIVSSLHRLEPRLRACGVSRLAIFGSRARGDHQPESDLDVLIDIRAGIKFSLLDLVGVSHVISDELGIPANIFMRRSLEPGIAETIRPDIVEVFDA